MLETARLLSYLNNEKNILIHFLEGQKIIHDLALTHKLTGKGLNYFRTATLTILPLTSLLKENESLGFYIDSEDPFFILKLEANDQGHVRTLLLPENFDQFPEKIKGKSRLIKKIKNALPYSSFIELDQVSIEEVINEVLKVSYQIKAKIWVGEKTDQCMMLMRLPDPTLTAMTDQLSHRDFLDYLKLNKTNLLEILNTDITDVKQLQNLFLSHGYHQINSRPIQLHCSCSRESVLLNLYHLARSSTDLADLFSSSSPGPEPELTIHCDYCKAKYIITQSELESFIQSQIQENTP